MLIECPECKREVSDSAPSCPSCGFPIRKDDAPKLAQPPAITNRPPILLVLAGVCLLATLSAPRFLVFFPVMLTVGLALGAWFRGERGRVLAILIVLLSGALWFWSMSDSTTSSASLSSAEIADWNWQVDPTFGSNGTVKWNVAVRNVSSRPIESAKVEFTTYDKAGKLLDSTFTYVDAIPPGETRSADSYADYYGSEEKAETRLSSVNFSD